MTTENPNQETPETDAQKIERLEGEMIAANEIIASQQDSIDSAKSQKKADDAELLRLTKINVQYEQYISQYSALVGRIRKIDTDGETPAEVRAIQADVLALKAAVKTAKIANE
jgi:hypothetical protein